MHLVCSIQHLQWDHVQPPRHGLKRTHVESKVRKGGEGQLATVPPSFPPHPLECSQANVQACHLRTANFRQANPPTLGRSTRGGGWRAEGVVVGGQAHAAVVRQPEPAGGAWRLLMALQGHATKHTWCRGGFEGGGSTGGGQHRRWAAQEAGFEGGGSTGGGQHRRQVLRVGAAQEVGSTGGGQHRRWPGSTQQPRCVGEGGRVVKAQRALCRRGAEGMRPTEACMRTGERSGSAEGVLAERRSEHALHRECVGGWQSNRRGQGQEEGSARPPAS